MHHFFYISGFANAITFTILGLLVFFNNPKRKLNQLNALTNFSVVVWALSYGFWQISKDYQTAFLWAKMLNFGAVFVPVFLLHWSLTFLGIEKEKKNRIILILSYLVTLFFAFFSFTPYYVRDIEPVLFFTYWPMPGILHPFYLLFCWGGMMGYMLFSLWRGYKTSAEYKREQIKYILIGSILGVIGGGSNFLLWYGIPVAPWGNPLVMCWAVLLFYTVLRYRVMDIRWILGRTGIYALSFLCVLLYTFGIFYFNQKLGELILPMILASFVVITAISLFLYFFRFFEKIAAKYFYYTLYTLQTILYSLSKQLNQIIELDKLTTLINRSLLDALKLDRVGVILREPEEKNFYLQELIKFKKEDITSILALKQNFLIKYLQKTKEPLIRKEINFLIREKKEEKTDLSFLGEKMEKAEISLFLPLFIKEELMGIIVLGSKLSGKPYTVQDIDLLTTLSAQSSVAFNNALSYNEIQKRKAELERFYKLTIGRELRMIELKKKIKELGNEMREK